MGSDRPSTPIPRAPCNFNPRSPDGERQCGKHTMVANARYFNPRSPDGERPCEVRSAPSSVRISIHAPRMGSDCVQRQFPDHPLISIHAPRMGSDATGVPSRLQARNFNPRSPDGERLRQIRPTLLGQNFNPRSPDGERPARLTPCRHPARNFNPRSPDGERPRKWTSSPTIWAKSSIFNTDCIADRR